MPKSQKSTLKKHPANPPELKKREVAFWPRFWTLPASILDPQRAISDRISPIVCPKSTKTISSHSQESPGKKNMLGIKQKLFGLMLVCADDWTTSIFIFRTHLAAVFKTGVGGDTPHGVLDHRRITHIIMPYSLTLLENQAVRLFWINVL